MERYIVLHGISVLVEFAICTLSIIVGIMLEDVLYCILGALYVVNLFIRIFTVWTLHRNLCKSILLIIVSLFLMSVVILCFMFIVCIYGTNHVVAFATLLINYLIQLIFTLVNVATIVSSFICKVDYFY